MYNLIKDWSLDEHSYLRENVPKMGLQTPFRDGTLQDVALKVRSVQHAPPMHSLSQRRLISDTCHRAGSVITVEDAALTPTAEGVQQRCGKHAENCAVSRGVHSNSLQIFRYVGYF